MRTGKTKRRLNSRIATSFTFPQRKNRFYESYKLLSVVFRSANTRPPSYWYVADVAFALRDLFETGVDLSHPSFHAFIRGYSQHYPLVYATQKSSYLLVSNVSIDLDTRMKC